MALLCLSACASHTILVDNQTGYPLKNYEVTLTTPGSTKLTAYFHAVRIVEAGKYSYQPEYLNVLEHYKISKDKTKSLQVILRMVNPNLHEYSVSLTVESLGRFSWKAGEPVYSGAEIDKVFTIDCPLAAGEYKVTLWIYSGGRLIFTFGDFEYTVS